MNRFEDFVSARPNPELFEVKDIDPQELWNKRDNVTIVDVRRPDEYNGELGHVPGAQHIVLDSLPEHVENLPKNATVVFVCRSGGRSARATAWALSEGFESVYNLKGGMLLWNKLNMEIEK